MQKVNSLESFTLNRKEKASRATSYYFVYSIQFWFFDTRSRLQKQSPNKKGVQKQFNFSKKHNLHFAIYDQIELANYRASTIISSLTQIRNSHITTRMQISRLCYDKSSWANKIKQKKKILYPSSFGSQISSNSLEIGTNTSSFFIHQYITCRIDADIQKLPLKLLINAT